MVIGDLKLNPEAEQVSQKNKDSVTFVQCDVTKWKDLENLILVSKREFHDVPDVYVPSAGVFEPVRE